MNQNESELIVHIIIRDTFEGDLAKWSDTFFGFPPGMQLGPRLLMVKEFCDSMGWEVGIGFA